MRFVELLIKYHALFMVALIGLLHAPFILSDPDTQVSPISRGAWTDEGLNTIQVRNFVNHGYLSMDECDNLVKTPYFGFILVPFYSLLGTHIWVGRLLILICVLVTLFVFIRDEATKPFGIVFGIIGMLEFHVFHYSHYSMAEMLAISWILLGIYLQWYAKKHDGNWWLAASAACFSLAYYSKVTFAYVIMIPFTVSYFEFVSERIRKTVTIWHLLKDWGIQLLATAFFGISFYLKWYLPNETVFKMVHESQGQGRYDISEAWTRFLFNLQEFVLADGIKLTVMLVPIAIIVLLFTKFTEQKRILSFGLLSWLMLELHHGLLVNPPTRYLLPLYVACLAVVALALAESATGWFGRTVIYVTVLLLGGYNLSYYWDSLCRRSFQVEEVRSYLAHYDLRHETILGVWGATLASETQARCIPIWSDFNRKEDPMAEYRPRIVLTEHNEAECGEAFISKQIRLEEESDSLRQFDVWRYKVNAFWFGQK